MTTPGLPPQPTYGSSFRPIQDSDLTGYGSAYDGDVYDLDYEDYELGLGDRFRAFIGRGLVRLGWIALAAGLAFGSAGIVAAAEHSPSTGTRPELNWSADQTLTVRLNGAVRDLARLDDDVQSLFTQGMNTLKGLTQINQVVLQNAWNEGATNVNAMTAGAADLTKSLRCGDWDPSMRADLIKTYSPVVVDRYIEVCQAIATVPPLQDDWHVMFDGSRTAIAVVNDIEDWNSAASDARTSATQGQYSDALTKLRTAAASITDASRIATNLAVTKDVSTLTSWLTRITDVDNALGILWQQMIDSKGVVNAQVAAALRNVSDANALLPQTNDAYASSLQVVMYEMAGDLVSEASAINESNGALANAIADLTGGGAVYGR